MPYSEERELEEPTSSRKTGHQVKDGVAIPLLWLGVLTEKKKGSSKSENNKNTNIEVSLIKDTYDVNFGFID